MEEEEEYIRARYPRSCRSPLLCPLCNQQHQFAACPFRYYEEPKRPRPQREESVRPRPEREESVHPWPERKEPVCPVSGGEEPVCPVSGGEEPVCPVSGGEEPVRPVSGGEEPVRPVSGGEKLKAQTPIFFWGGRGHEAQAPQQPLFLLLKGAQRRRPPPALTPLSEEPAAPPEGNEQLFPPPPPEGDELLFPLPPSEELEWALPPVANREEELWPLPPWPEVPALLATPKDACSASPWEPPVAEYEGEVALPLPPSWPGAPLPSSPPEGPLPPSPPKGPASGVAASPEWQQEVLWPEPHKGELPATKKGGGEETTSTTAPTTTPVPQPGAWGLDPSAWAPGHPGSMSGPLVAGPDSQVAAPPDTGGRLVSCTAPPGCPDVAALSPGLAPLSGAAANWSPACAPDAPSNAPGSPFARSRSRQEGAGLWTDPPSALGEGGSPTMAAPLGHLLPLVRDFGTKGGGGHLGHVVLRTRRGGV
ncbi:UNVERIFIED_CONTAM: hypothetical protein FKN15_068430 [Acipenser sinensis]